MREANDWKHVPAGSTSRFIGVNDLLPPGWLNFQALKFIGTIISRRDFLLDIHSRDTTVRAMCIMAENEVCGMHHRIFQAFAVAQTQR